MGFSLQDVGEFFGANILQFSRGGTFRWIEVDCITGHLEEQDEVHGNQPGHNIAKNPTLWKTF